MLEQTDGGAVPGTCPCFAEGENDIVVFARPRISRH